jgi:hypothetical protein
LCVGLETVLSRTSHIEKGDAPRKTDPVFVTYYGATVFDPSPPLSAPHWHKIILLLCASAHCGHKNAKRRAPVGEASANNLPARKFIADIVL